MQQLPKLPPNLQSLVNPNGQGSELPAVYARNPFPNGIDALISGINNQNLNYGNKNLLDLEKRMSKQDITAGLQTGLNFGIPEIAQAQQTSPYHFANNTEVLPQDAEIPATRQVGQPLGAIEDFMPGGSKSQTPVLTGGTAKQRPSLLSGLQDLYNGAAENANTPFGFNNLQKRIDPRLYKQSINPDDYNTKLSAQDEIAYQQWLANERKIGAINPQDNGNDYDFRGAFKGGLTPGADGHWADTYKKPNHETFSNESQYATGNNASYAGRWNGNEFIAPRNENIMTRVGEGLGSVGKFAASPTGRALMTGLLVAGTGGNGTQAMTYGLQAGLGNYNNVQQDKMNRNLLQANGIDTSNIRGYLNNENTKALTDNYYKLNGAMYRNNSLILRQQLGLLGDNTKRINAIKGLLNSGNITPQEAEEQLKSFGMDTDISGVSNQTRNADMREELLPYQKYALKTAPQIAMGNMGINAGRLNLSQMEADPNYQASVTIAKENAKKQAENYNKDVETYNSYTSKMPELRAQVAKLNQLAKTATYTKIGVAGDSITRQMGLPVSKGAVARTEYTATINNQILPLLRETFGAQFTEREGEALRQSLGDVNKSPAEKQAVLNSFIKQKEMNIQSQARKVQQYSGGAPKGNGTPQRAVSKSGRPMIKVNGVWQYE